VTQGVIDFSEGEVNSSAGRGGGVVYVPFCLHTIKEVVSAMKVLSKYFAVSFVSKSDLTEHALWSATRSIDQNVAKESFGVSIGQEDSYCTISSDELGSIIDNTDLVNVLGGIENFDEVRMIKLSVLKQFDTNNDGRRCDFIDKGGFVGLKEPTEVKQGIVFGERLISHAASTSTPREEMKPPTVLVEADADEDDDDDEEEAPINTAEAGIIDKGEAIQIDDDVLPFVASFLCPPSFRQLANASNHYRRLLLRDDSLVKQMRRRNIYFSMLNMEVRGTLAAEVICGEDQLLMVGPHSLVPRTSAFTSTGCKSVAGEYHSLSVTEAACSSALGVKGAMLNNTTGDFVQGFMPTNMLIPAVDDNNLTTISFALTNPFHDGSTARAACFGVQNGEFCRVACVGYDIRYGGFIAVGFGAYERERLPNLLLCGRYLDEGDCRLNMSAQSIFDSSRFFQWSPPWETALLNFDAIDSMTASKATQYSPEPPIIFRLRLQLKCRLNEGGIGSLIYHLSNDAKKNQNHCAECGRPLHGRTFQYDMDYRSDEIDGLESCTSRLRREAEAEFCSEQCFITCIAPFADFVLSCNRRWEMQCAGCGDRVHPKNAPEEKDRMAVFYQIESKRKTSSGHLIGGIPPSRLLLCSPSCACAALPEVERFCREDWQGHDLTRGGRSVVLKVMPSIADEPVTLALMKDNGWNQDKDQHFVSNDPSNNRKPKFNKWGLD